MDFRILGGGGLGNGDWGLGWFGQEDPQNLRISMTQIVRELRLPNVNLSILKNKDLNGPNSQGLQLKMYNFHD